ncbi:MAG: recombination protein RecR [Candidatus Pacebacteria bacterium]|nr:recombination protein RecR [Candidatus Paceibacterota bacterium]MBP9772505.1 recombination protein RecR [Candidatus Paceibacterota bacterium]
MDPIDNLANIFKRFPGIGVRQARRFVYFLLNAPDEYKKELIKELSNLNSNISTCPSCFIHFARNDEDFCDICRKKTLDTTSLLVVEKDSDCESFKRTHAHKGKYFILGSLVPPVEKNVQSHIRERELIKIIKDRASEGLKEIILAFPATPDGEHTDSYIRNTLKDLTDENNIKITSLGRGLSTGSEPEYADSETLKSALGNRH